MQWPKERERSIQAAKERRQYWIASGQAEQKRRQMQSAQARSARYHEFPKKKFLQNSDQQFKNISKILSKTIPQPVVTVRTFCKPDERNVEVETKQKALMNFRQGRIKTATMKHVDEGKVKSKSLIYTRKRTESEMETQGDHLNQIKALRKMNSRSNQGKQYLYPVQKKHVGVGC